MWLCPPNAPGTPFATPWLVFLDLVRVYVMLAALVVVIQTPRIVAIIDRRQACRFVALSLFCGVNALTQFLRLGDAGSLQLFLQAIAVTFALVGLYGFRRDQKANEPRTPPPAPATALKGDHE